jgi:hypothetical protein
LGISEHQQYIMMVTGQPECIWFSKMFLLQKVNFYHKNSIPKGDAVFG